MKKLVVILFLLFSLFSHAQIASIFADEFQDEPKVQIGFTVDYDNNSNVMTNSFISKLYRGGYINDELKNSVSSRVKNTNRAGGNFNAGMFTSFRLDPNGKYKNYALFFSLRDREHYDAQFSKDLFMIGFYGNAQYAGKTADLSNFGLQLIRYQQLQVGIFSSKLDSAARWGIGVSFLNGEQYASVTGKNAALFTSADGQYIDLDSEFSAVRSDTANKGFLANNGLGASMDLYFEAPFETNIGKSKLCASVSDLGVIRFNKETEVLNRDTLFHFTGFEINRISDLQDSIIRADTKDSLKNTFTPFKKQKHSATIPAVLNLTFETKLNSYLRLTEGVRYMFNANYKALWYVKGTFYLHPKIQFSTTFSYGGYGTFNYGLGISAKLAEKFLVHIGSNNIEGYIVPKKTTGQGTYFSLVKQF